MHLRLTFLFLLSLASFVCYGSGQTAADWAAKPDPQAISNELAKQPDPELSQRLTNYLAKPTPQSKELVQEWLGLRETVALVKPSAQDKSRVQSIKSNPLFRDRGEGEESNWIAKLFEKFGNFRPPAPKLNGPSFSPFGIGSWLVPVMWTFLAGLVTFFAYQAFKHVKIRQRIKRRSQALLEEDEPERTQDEWLTLSDQYARQGEYRLAVRCLYIASLLRFDEHRVARFDRRQTNWEHLERIEGSPSYDSGLNFRSTTQRFDRIWYGYEATGPTDLAEIRTVYEGILSQFAGAKP